jgi:hypothetical protein
MLNLLCDPVLKVYDSGLLHSVYCIVLYSFQIPTDPYTGMRTSHKPQDIESVIAIQYKMFQQRNLST